MFHDSLDLPSSCVGWMLVSLNDYTIRFVKYKTAKGFLSFNRPKLTKRTSIFLTLFYIDNMIRLNNAVFPP